MPKARLILLILPGLLLAFALANLRLDSLSPAGSNLLFGLVAAGTCFQGLARQLPLQNVFAVAVLLGVSGAGADLLFHFCQPANARSDDVPFIENLLAASLVWNAVLVSSREISKFVLLRTFKRIENRRLWVVGAAMLLSILMLFHLEPFSSAPRSATSGQGTCMYLILALLTAFSAVFTSPWLMKKEALPDHTAVASGNQPGAIPKAEFVIVWSVLALAVLSSLFK